MADDWQVGDLALCVDGVFFHEDGSPATVCPQEGGTYAVAGTGRYGPMVWIDLLGFGDLGCDAAQFRKIRPDQHERCEDEFVTLLNRLKQPKEAVA